MLATALIYSAREGVYLHGERGPDPSDCYASPEGEGESDSPSDATPLPYGIKPLSESLWWQHLSWPTHENLPPMAWPRKPFAPLKTLRPLRFVLFKHESTFRCLATI